MILLGKIGNIEVALRYKYDPDNVCHYETKKLVIGTIKALVGRNAPRYGFPIKYEGYFESMFDKLKPFRDHKQKNFSTPYIEYKKRKKGKVVQLRKIS
jgi:hypothetical protein